MQPMIFSWQLIFQVVFCKCHKYLKSIKGNHEKVPMTRWSSRPPIKKVITLNNIGQLT
jgi:hypothetical protein